MEWLEIIELHSAGGDQGALESNLRELIQTVHESGEGLAVRLFQRHGVEGDYTIHIMHHEKERSSCGSSLGLHLAWNLKLFGLVNHTIWTSIHRQGGVK